MFFKDVRTFTLKIYKFLLTFFFLLFSLKKKRTIMKLFGLRWSKKPFFCSHVFIIILSKVVIENGVGPLLLYRCLEFLESEPWRLSLCKFEPSKFPSVVRHCATDRADLLSTFFAGCHVGSVVWMSLVQVPFLDRFLQFFVGHSQGSDPSSRSLLAGEQSDTLGLLRLFDGKSRHRRIKKQRRYERLAITSRWTGWGLLSQPENDKEEIFPVVTFSDRCDDCSRRLRCSDSFQDSWSLSAALMAPTQTKGRMLKILEPRMRVILKKAEHRSLSQDLDHS